MDEGRAFIQIVNVVEYRYVSLHIEVRHFPSTKEREIHEPKPSSYTKDEKVKVEREDGGGKVKVSDDNKLIKNTTVKIVKEVKNDDISNKNRNLSRAGVEEKVNPLNNNNLLTTKDKSKDHAEKTAEMKTMTYNDSNNKKRDNNRISKAVGDHGQEPLKNATAGKKKPISRRNEKKNEQVVPEKIVECNLNLYSHNIPCSKKEMKATLKGSFKPKLHLKPGASVGLISGIFELNDTIEKGNIEPYAYADKCTASTGVTENLLGVGKIAHASAAVAEVSAGYGKAIGISASALSATAHAQYGLNNAIGAGVSLVRAQANFGPATISVGVNLNTEAHIGVNGLGASVLGIGFSIGPTFSISTPFFDFSFSIL